MTTAACEAQTALVAGTMSGYVSMLSIYGADDDFGEKTGD